MNSQEKLGSVFHVSFAAILVRLSLCHVRGSEAQTSPSCFVSLAIELIRSMRLHHGRQRWRLNQSNSDERLLG